jgi:hypothetical protein
LLSVLFVMSGIVVASGPNYAISTEWSNQLGYTGYIQIRASYFDSVEGGHVGQGEMWYTNTQDTNHYFTDTAGWPGDTAIYSRTKDVRDLLNPFAPKAVFYKNFYVF